MADLSIHTLINKMDKDFQSGIGSLKEGMDADCVLWSGDPLDIRNHVQAVFISGALEYRRTT